ncbi:uncharacterized protein JCM15063_004563 [Sporobolomyces koalae]|uniref:uncharacterized protein n=1 Tax=Sporobolomyces koalae TaxID=500713 RepID=UPI003171887C
MSSDDRWMYQFPAGAGELSLDSLETPNWSPTPSPSPPPPVGPIQAAARLPVSRAPRPLPPPPPPSLSQSRPGVIGRNLATEQTVARALTDEAETSTPASSPRPVPSGSQSTAQGQAVLEGGSEPGAQDTLSLPRWSKEDNDVRVRALAQLQQVFDTPRLYLSFRAKRFWRPSTGRKRPWMRHSLPDDNAAVSRPEDNNDNGGSEG